MSRARATLRNWIWASVVSTWGSIKSYASVQNRATSERRAPDQRVAFPSSNDHAVSGVRLGFGITVRPLTVVETNRSASDGARNPPPMDTRHVARGVGSAAPTRGLTPAVLLPPCTA